ncbi:MAG: hypothetical protein SH868_09820 [Bythopirellula sp.]|nr:hypothetical protein [Bythopirellula sp.]
MNRLAVLQRKIFGSIGLRYGIQTEPALQFFVISSTRFGDDFAADVYAPDGYQDGFGWTADAKKGGHNFYIMPAIEIYLMRSIKINSKRTLKCLI